MNRLEVRAKITQLRAEGKDTEQIAKAVKRSPCAARMLELRMGSPRHKRGPKPSPEIAERNARICEAVEKGHNRELIGQRYGLTKSTINVIYSQRPRG